MWVDRAARGLGLARRLMTELEDRARAAGAPAVQLDTNRTLTEAIALYRKTGYVEIEPSTTSPTPTTGSERTCELSGSRATICWTSRPRVHRPFLRR